MMLRLCNWNWFALLFVIATSPVAAQSTPKESTRPGERVLLLKSGGVMKGRIRAISTGWLVSKPNGHVVIPFAQSRFDADDLNEIYLRIRLQTANPTAASHLALAEWCLSQRLYEEATRELRDTLKKQPSNETARLMLDRVEKLVKRQINNEAHADVRVDRVATNPDAPKVRSLGGLTPSTAQEFVSTIQPLLSNKCGNARCHGGSEANGFRLSKLTPGSSRNRIRIERNLAAVLDYVTPQQPLRSPLLAAASSAHGGRTIFNGRAAARQLDTLRKWVTAASEETSQLSSQPLTVLSAPDSDSDGSTQETSSEQIRRPPSRVPAADLNHPTTRAADSNSPGQKGTDSRDTRLTSFQQLLKEARGSTPQKDAFNPEEFNQRYSGSVSSSR